MANENLLPTDSETKINYNKHLKQLNKTDNFENFKKYIETYSGLSKFKSDNKVYDCRQILSTSNFLNNEQKKMGIYCFVISDPKSMELYDNMLKNFYNFIKNKKNNDYRHKYLKYKNKYLDLKNKLNIQ